MPCYTRVELPLDLEPNLEKEARRKLGLPESGYLTYRQASDVKVEAGKILATRQLRKLAPSALIRTQAGSRKMTVSISI